MPKFDLTRARRLKGPGGEIARLKGAGLLWLKPDLDLPLPVQASGGVETLIEQDGVTYRVHTFLENGTLTVTQGGEAEYPVVGGGGGGGGARDGQFGRGGGGGAGGVLMGTTLLDTRQISIVVGNGGAGTAAGNNGDSLAGEDGKNSSLGSLIAIGGGGGATRNNNTVGGSGGSGGGGTRNQNGTLAPPGSGTRGQGFDGGIGNTSNGTAAGGGGAGGPGGNAPEALGGPGITSSITGTEITYATGGDGGIENPAAEQPNTGNGGDGATPGHGANGSSGIVIVRYPLNGTVTRGDSAADSDQLTADSDQVMAGSDQATADASVSGSIEPQPELAPESTPEPEPDPDPDFDQEATGLFSGSVNGDPQWDNGVVAWNMNSTAYPNLLNYKADCRQVFVHPISGKPALLMNTAFRSWAVVGDNPTGASSMQGGDVFESNDGLSWTRIAQTPFIGELAYEWQGQRCMARAIIKDPRPGQDRWLCYFVGNGVSSAPGMDGTIRAVGAAVSTDNTQTWTIPEAPNLLVTQAGILSWAPSGANRLYPRAVVYHDGWFYLYVEAGLSPNYEYGWVRSLDGETGWESVGSNPTPIQIRSNLVLADGNYYALRRSGSSHRMVRSPSPIGPYTEIGNSFSISDYEFMALYRLGTGWGALSGERLSQSENNNDVRRWIAT